MLEWSRPAVLAGAVLAGAIADAATLVTHQREDGNRVIEGHGPGASFEVLDVELPARPQWLLAAPVGDAVHWIVTLEDGRVLRVDVSARARAWTARADRDRLPAGAPPAATAGDGGTQLIARRQDSSPHTHPVSLGRQRPAVDLDLAGGLRLDPTAAPLVGVLALPDARILHDGAGRLMVLTEPSTRYGHGVLGDAIEAGSVTIVDTRSGNAMTRFAAGAGRVIEGIAPIWADLDGDGVAEVVVTESDASSGARLVAYAGDGTLAASSDPIGLGHRWRHQIAVGATRPDGVPELMSVRTPHIGGVAEFMRRDGERLVIVARHGGVSSHAYGSRNLDAAAALDWDGDGDLELVVPTVGHEALAVIDRTASGTSEIARLALDARLSTNLAGVRDRNGAVHLGAGADDARLRIWLPADFFLE